MKYVFGLICVAFLAIPEAAIGITIDGVADTAYGSAIATQQIGTVAGDNTYGNQGIANGSELDGAYGFVSNGVLYLVMAGNFNSLPVFDGGTSPNDYLNIFFMTGPGGDHTLGTNYTATFNGRINSMGVGANGTDPSAPGLTFDTGFAANYWMGVNVGLDEAQDNTNTVFVDYQVVCSNCPSAYFGSVTSTNSPPNVLTNVYFGSSIQVSLNNTNLNGVNGTPCYTNTSGAAQSIAAAAVRTGAELAIPLAALGSPTGDVYICSFITDKFFLTMYNQVLGAVWDGTTTYCQSFLAGGNPAYVNFSTLPGQNFFKVTVPPCDIILVNPTSASYTLTGGTGTVTVANSGGCPITVTPSTNWLAVISSSGLGSGNGSFTYTVAPNTNSINSRTAQFIITDTAVTGIATSIVTITQAGVPAPPLSTTFTIDGIAESTYGCPLSVQDIQTQFGNNIQTNLQNNTGGSELDAAYGMIKDGVMFLVLAGNLEANFNRLDIFFMTGPGGQNTLTNVNPNIDFNGLNDMGSSTNPAAAGLTFHTGFAPNYWISVNNGVSGTYQFFVNYAQLWPGATNALGVATNGLFLGSTTITNGTLIGGTNPFGIQATINNSNTNGVDGGTCATNAAGQVESALATNNVRTGIELGIPLGALGSPTGAIAVVAFINNNNHTFMSNQMLPPLGTNSLGYCQGNLGAVGSTRTINFTNYPGEASFLVGPEMRITSISTVATNVVLSYQTAASTNLTYQVQRTSALTTNTTWSSVGGLQLGNGGVITTTIINGATNNPAQFYRVRQTPLCP